MSDARQTPYSATAHQLLLSVAMERIMKRFLLATVGLVALVGIAAPARRGYGGQGKADGAGDSPDL